MTDQQERRRIAQRVRHQGRRWNVNQRQQRRHEIACDRIEDQLSPFEWMEPLTEAEMTEQQREELRLLDELYEQFYYQEYDRMGDFPPPRDPNPPPLVAACYANGHLMTFAA